MCASYGLGGGPYPDDDRWQAILPFDEKVVLRDVRAWMREGMNAARITGKNARNLNPIIVDGADGRDVEFAWWWLHLRGEPATFSAFNATVEKLGSSWRMGMARRALAPATWYVERGEKFGLGGDAFGIAAITTTVTKTDGSEMLSYAIVTRPAVAAAAEIHPRMPMILPRDMHDDWLDRTQPGSKDLIAAALASSEEVSRQVENASRGRG